MSRASSKGQALRLVKDRAWPPVAEPVLVASFAAASAVGAAYHPGQANRCPHCAATAFHVGRVTAECGGCGNPLPIAPDRHDFPRHHFTQPERN